MLAEKISGTRNFLLCRCTKEIANNRRRHARGRRAGFAARRKFGTHLPPQDGKCRIPAIFSPNISPSLPCLETFPLLVSFEVLHVKKPPRDRF
jgi:hypothetical protein